MDAYTTCIRNPFMNYFAIPMLTQGRSFEAVHFIRHNKLVRDLVGIKL